MTRVAKSSFLAAAPLPPSLGGGGRVDEATHQALLGAWLALPEDIRYPPAAEDQLRSFESEFGPIPLEFRRFLAEFGGGVVGREWVDGIRELPFTHGKFRKEFGPHGWSMADVFVIGWDGAGNPFGIDRSSGKVLVEDHNLGGIHEIAESFGGFLEAGLKPDA
jgi:hypothetical protein